MLLNQSHRLKRYIASILIGLPVWFCIGVLIKFSEKFAVTNHVDGEVKISFAIMYAYIGLSVGDLLSGLLSQIFRSRKKIVWLYLIMTSIVTCIFLYSQNLSNSTYYIMCFLIGTATGYWALFVTMASESFGTNIRATVTTTVPNFVRGAVVPITLGFKSLESGVGNTNSALIIGIICIALAMISLFFIPESFGKDLEYTEV